MSQKNFFSDPDFPERVLPGVLSADLVCEVASSARMPTGADAYGNRWIAGELPNRGAKAPPRPAFQQSLLDEALEFAYEGPHTNIWPDRQGQGAWSWIDCPRMIEDHQGIDRVLVCVGQSGYQPDLQAGFGRICESDRVGGPGCIELAPHIHQPEELLECVDRVLARARLASSADRDGDRARLEAMCEAPTGRVGVMLAMHMTSREDRVQFLVDRGCIVFELERKGDSECSETCVPLRVARCSFPTRATRIVHVLDDCMWDSEPSDECPEHSFRVSLRAATHSGVEIWYTEREKEPLKLWAPARQKKNEPSSSADERITPPGPGGDDDEDSAGGGPGPARQAGPSTHNSSGSMAGQASGVNAEIPAKGAPADAPCETQASCNREDEESQSGGPHLQTPGSALCASPAFEGSAPLAINLFSHRGPLISVGPSDICALPGDATHIWINDIYSKLLLAPKRKIPLQTASWHIESRSWSYEHALWKAGGKADLSIRQYGPDVATLVTIGITPAIWTDLCGELYGGADINCFQYQDYLWHAAPEMRPEWTLKSAGKDVTSTRRIDRIKHYWRMSPPTQEDGTVVNLRGMPCDHWPTKEWVAACGIDPTARVSRAVFIWLHGSGLMSPSKAWEAWGAGRIQEYRRRMDEACGVDTRNQDNFYDKKCQTAANALQICSYELRKVEDPRVAKIQVTPPAENSRVLQVLTREDTHIVTAGLEGPVLTQKKLAQKCRAVVLETAEPVVHTSTFGGQFAH